MYDTDVVTAYADGTFTVADGGWSTMTTGAFISLALRTYRVACYQSRGKLWLHDRATSVKFPVTNKPLRLRKTDALAPLTTVDDNYTIKVKVSDRKATAEVYAKVQPFLNWVGTFLEMSDGWLMHETRKAVLGLAPESSCYDVPTTSPSGVETPKAIRNWQNAGYTGVPKPDRPRVIEWLCNLHPDDYLFTFCLLGYNYTNDTLNPYGNNNNPNMNVAEVGQREFLGRKFPAYYYNTKQDVGRIKAEIQNMVRSVTLYQKIVEKKPDGIIRGNVI